MSLIYSDYYDLGDETNPVETIDMTSPPSETAAIEVFRAYSEAGFFPRYVCLFYKTANLAKTTGVCTGEPRIGPVVGTAPATSASGRLWYFPQSSVSGGPANTVANWIAGSTPINLHGDSTANWALSSFLLGFPASGGTTNFGECQPIQYPVAWLDLTISGWTAGTLSWWATLIK